ncbi:histone-lysine N-methyltransferase ATXR3-like isoform X1 [Cucurbita moschata]|uniref:Histone-lysine N-methyltransferase ATXR3-like isoform X1 n=1 Tax=Cucurbita moschata TaxID=3662 RepID=A0A6J1GKE2_CUCMO|nr:histone-lysine N-methyltransferase ATXR3-like isoform X1 [Cucurbita moschata]XP_022952502.1 histone-lysine N-methyltransferase ATXR3-like isoform X1 [Cucurbita moschata]
MGDGGVACIPLQQQQQHITETFPIPSEKMLCAGKNNGFNSKSSAKFSEAERKQTMKVKKEEVVAKDVELGRTESGSDKPGKSSRDVGHAENGVDNAEKDEVEEGELGTLKWSRVEVENGEFVPEKSKRGGIENNEKWRKAENEKEEHVRGKWRRGDIEKGEIVPDRSRKGEAENRSRRLAKDEIERGEFIPDRWEKGDIVKDDFRYSRTRRYESEKDRGWRSVHESTPPLVKYSTDDVRRKELNRSGNQHGKGTPRWESGQDRGSRYSSKLLNDEVSHRNDYNDGKNFGKDYSSSNRLKRYSDYGDYAGSKSRKLSEESSRTGHSDHYSTRPMERSGKNSSSSSQVSSSDKFSTRHYESSSTSSREAYNRHGHSPGHSDRSPLEKARYHDHNDRSPAPRDRSPYGRDRSPYGRDRSPYGRDRSPYGRDKSPYDRSRHYDHRHRSPHAERSPQDRARCHGRRAQTPNYLDRSPLDRSRTNNHRETNRRSKGIEKHSLHNEIRTREDKTTPRDPDGKESIVIAKESCDEIKEQNTNGSIETVGDCRFYEGEKSKSPNQTCLELSHVDGVPEELPSMEEDMDICDTPPHAPLVTETSTGKWFYLDYYGVERGPTRLYDLKTLVEEGSLMSDHFIKHLDSDRWVTVENAVSPLATINFPSVVPDSVTQLVSPPEAPGNVLADTIDSGKLNIQGDHSQLPSGGPTLCSHEGADTSEPLRDLHIDERISILLEDITVVPGRELETIAEVLQMTLDGEQWERLAISEGFSDHVGEQLDEIADDILELTDFATSVDSGSKTYVSSDKDFGIDDGDLTSGPWSCKGGDWRRNDESSQERNARKKLVLNDGFPLCQMSKSGYEDPRWHQKDELYYPSQSRRLDLPPWAFTCLDDRPTLTVRGTKGTMLPVIRINACVVKDHGSFVSEPRMKVRGKGHSRSRLWSSNSDGKRSADGDFHLKIARDVSLERSLKTTGLVSIPKDRLCSYDDLQLHLGVWYYLDGAGHECGPSSFSELQLLVDQGVIQKNSSVFRKFDRVWVPVTSFAECSELTKSTQREKTPLLGETTKNSVSVSGTNSFGGLVKNSNAFHELHPQFIGYTRGKLHELVMKFYKSREFAAAINDVLDPWINAKQPKKEMEKTMHWKSDGSARAAKRARLLVDESEDDYEVDEDSLHQHQNDEIAFEDLCGDATFHGEGSTSLEVESWGFLDGHILARIFHFLQSDLKSLSFASVTCKHWRAAVRFYKDISRQVDLSTLGSNCTNSTFMNIMSTYNKEKVNSIILVGCTNISPVVLEEVVGMFPQLAYINVRGCSQFDDLSSKYPNINRVKRSLNGIKNNEETHSKMRSLRHITEKSSSLSKIKGVSSNMDDFGELKEYFESVDKRESANQLFRRSLYKRSKVFDARKSSSIVSRDARMRQWSIKKSEVGYKRMVEFLASSLKEIMKDNTFEFFVPKVAEIQDRIRNGYYIKRGLGSVKEDIRRMCRDAIKAKNRGDGDANHIITQFIQLATRLEKKSKVHLEKDEVSSWEDDSSSRLGSSSASKFKRRLGKMATERKYTNRSNGSIFGNGTLDHGEYASDREIRRRLSRLNKKAIGSESETSDEFDMSSGDGKSDSENSVLDTESDLEFSSGRLGESRGDKCFIIDEAFDSTMDDREWGARMTKVSLVPPVTRKYELIDEYVVIADEEEVRRKMRVSLPDDYVEKLNAQKNGVEELDMELPEVKDYKPRKKIGDEVLEQEVYGIDPYTHNLLLDSVPEELDWPLMDKHLFIEDVLLRTLNKQAIHFTGSGNTPMMHPLQPVIEEIEKVAAEECDIRTMRLCQGILKAIHSRPEDKYVAYRKGLGVVCNKQEGFGEDDFIVEFLGEVYPVWKWFEKQDGIRSLQKNDKDPAPEFYNIYLERPKGDGDGYDLVVVDAMHKANYASRICHSCRPNCEAKVTAVDGHYQIGIYSLRKIQYGEEITFDYNSVTESKEEYEASVCLCGSHVCRGSYLNLTGDGAFLKVLEEWHGVLDCHQLMLEACELNSVSEDDYLDLGRAGLGSCLLGGLPDWLVAYSARVVRFINFERTKLPEEILTHNLEEKRKYFSDICLDVEKSDAEVQAEGVYNQRLQNLAITLDKVRYVMRCIFGDPKNAPPPLKRLSPEEAVTYLWKGEGSLVEELLQSMAPHVEEDLISDLKANIRAHDPLDSGDIQKELQQSLLWLRDEVRNIPCTYKSRNDAAADLIHIYAFTKNFFRIQEYKAVTSPPVYISSLDLGPKYVDKLGTGFQEYRKTYGQNYCLGQLIFWHNQQNTDPDCSLAKASMGCISLPEMGSFYARVQKPSRQRVYGPKTVKFMLSRMEKQPQRPWPKDRIWSFKNCPKVIGSPMLDAVLNNSPLEKDLVHWLKHRTPIFQAMWDR